MPGKMVWRLAVIGLAFALAPFGSTDAFAEYFDAVAPGTDSRGESNVAVASAEEEGDALSDAAFLDAGPVAAAYEDQYPSFPVWISGIQQQSHAQSMLEMVNNLRASKGVAPLKWSRSLEEIAIQRSGEISLQFSHTRPDGSDCFSLYSSDVFFNGENIAMNSGGVVSAEYAFNLWKNSPGHYANMIRDGFTHIGIACFVDANGNVNWVQCFGVENGSDANESHSAKNGSLTLEVMLPDSFIAGKNWTATSLTPGVESLRVLPSSTVWFEGQLEGAQGYNRVEGDVTYNWSAFGWSSDDQNIAAFAQLFDSVFAIGVSPGTTSFHAALPSSNKLDASFIVNVSEQGAFKDVIPDNTDHDESILWLSGSGVTAGYNDGTFRPYINVARCDMAAFLRRLAVAAGVGDAVTWIPSDSDWKRFSDVNSGTPHATDVLWLAHSGISEGFKDGTFRPYAIVTRQDMAAFLRRLASKSSKSDAATWKPINSDWESFVDINPGTDHAEDVLWLAHAGISTGFPGKRFEPLGSIVRCDMAAFLERLYNDMA